MKKNRCSVPQHTASIIKCLLMMKIVVLLICLFSLQSIANNGFAQEKITLKLENASLRKAFKVIEKQSSFRFVYNEEVLPSDQKITINVQERPVDDVMQKLLEHTTLTFKIVGIDLIVISAQLSDRAAPDPNPTPAFVISGKITNSRSEALANVSVLEKGTTNGTSTKDDGTFSIDVSGPKAILVISSVGFATQEISLNGRNSINIVLAENANDLNQVIVVGYGTQKRSDVTGAVATVPKSRLSQIPVTNILHAIEGAVAGVSITQTSSVPGSSATALIRGVNSINANTGPFVVVDGIPFSTTGGGINDINPNDIEDIQVLKDASAVAIYGTRGANGVILITTKRGTSGKPMIRYNGYAGLEQLAHTLDPMSPAQYVQKYADYLKQRGLTQTKVLENLYEINNYNAGKTVDWLKEVQQQGVLQDHNISISGGTKDFKYYVSGEFLKQQGIVKGYQYRRANLRANLDINITDYLTAGTTLFYTNNNYDGGRANFYLAASMSPYGQLYNANGKYEIYPMNPELLYTNPLLGLYNDRIDRSNNLNGNFYIDIKPAILPGLKYRLNAAYTYVPARRGNYTGRASNDQLGTASLFNSENNTWVIENILSYTKDWSRHHIDFTGLYSAQRTEFFASAVNATGFINDQLSFYNISAGGTLSAAATVNGGTNGSYRYRTSLLSQMGRINYSYDSRYLFTFTARRDGYSAFGVNSDKYGLFPSFAVGWNISNEEFMQKVNFVNTLKLRASYGKSGNQAIDPYQTKTLDASVRSPFAGLSTVGVLANTLGNANLNWESTKGLNIGLDFSILKSRISGAIDYYKTRTEDILLQRNLPNATGYTSIWDNLGKTENRGIEITINTINVVTKDFKWESTINFSRNRNKLVELYGDGKDDLGNRWFLGQPLRVIYDYKMIGVWQVGEDPSQIDPVAKPGDLKFADINGDKQITAADRVVQGTTLPKWIGGLTNTFHYRNWHLNIFIQTFQGALKNNVNLTYADEAGRMNMPADIGYWTDQNKSNERPALSYFNTRGYGYPRDNSYTRIKDVTLSFIVPQRIIERAKLGGLTLYISGRNLYTFTKWKGWDPENDFTFRGIVNATQDWRENYPLVKSFVLGLNVSLR